MIIYLMHWPKDIEEARDIQNRLREEVKAVPLDRELSLIAGVDAAFMGDTIIAAVCLYKYPEITLIEDAHAVEKVTFPYIPGFLSFREGPAFISAVNKLSAKPDVLLIDGQGIAHPRGLGIASHIGVLLDMPTIGCAKSLLVGRYEAPGNKKGSWSPLKYKGNVIGAVLRTRDNTNPVFVSVGHKIDLESSIKIVLSCTGKYRIPEPVRRADMLSKKLKMEL
ncbi:MAG: deoxyribonuclease V [Nitrospirota bacterium]